MHTGNAMRTRLSLLLIALMALPLLVGHGVSAQDATPADGSGATSDQFVDMSAFCEGIGTPTSGPSATGGDAQAGISLTNDRGVLAGDWEMPSGSHLILKGEVAFLAVEEAGQVIVVTCGAPLKYATEPAEDVENPTLFELPADMGLVVDSSFVNGIFPSYAGHPGKVAIVAQDGVDSTIHLEVAGSEETVGVCTATDCWAWTDVSTPESETPGGATPEAGAPTPVALIMLPRVCGLYRCP